MDIIQHLRALREERMRLINESRGIYDDAIAAKRTARRTSNGSMTILTPDEERTIARMDERVAELEAEITSLDQRDQRERESGIAREAFERQYGPTGAASADRREADNVVQWLRGYGERNEDFEPGRRNAIALDLRAAMREKEAIRQGADPKELRALYWDTGSVGSSVPTTLARTLYEYMEASVAALRMPTTRITTDSGETMQFPRLSSTGHSVATQVIAQGTAIGGTDPAFARLQLDAFKYGQLVQIANEVIQDSGIDIVSFIGRDIGRAVGRLMNADLIAGTGSGEPQGMTTAVTVGSGGTVATGGTLITPTYENLVDLAYSVADEYRASPGVGWLMRDQTAGVLRKLRDGAGGTIGRPIWEPSFTAGMVNGQPDRLLGYPVWTDPSVASLASNARIVHFGDWNSYYLRTVGNLVIERDDSFAFDRDVATFRGKWRADGDFADLSAVNLLKQSVT